MPAEKTRPGSRSASRTQKALDKSGEVIQEKLEENQRRLDVGKDHRTPSMKKGRRGTYP